MATRKTLQILDILGKKANQLDNVSGVIPNNFLGMVSDPVDGKLYNATKDQLQNFAGATLNGSDITNLVTQYLANNAVAVASRTNNIISFKRTSNTVYDIVDQFTGEYVSLNKATLKPGGSAITDADVNGIIYFKIGSEYFLRNFTGPLQAAWFGAKFDGVTNDIAALNATVAACKVLKCTNIKLPDGRAKLNSSWVVDGISWTEGSNVYWSAISVEGAGGKATILDFSPSSGTSCLIYGSNGTNTLTGVLSNFQIEGKSDMSMDGLSISSYAPTASAWCEFRNLYIKNVRDGVNNLMNPADLTSNFRADFKNIQVEKYSRIGFDIQGAYCTFDGLFVTQPNGETSISSPDLTKGANTLGVRIAGVQHTIGSMQTEDQILIQGFCHRIGSISIEYILKGQGNPSMGGAAIKIDGSQVSIHSMLLQGFRNTIISKIGVVNGNNTLLCNVLYTNSGNPTLFNIAEPIVLQNGSSGTIVQYNCPTTKGINHTDYAPYTDNWSYINVLGEGGVVFTKFSNTNAGSHIVDAAGGFYVRAGALVLDVPSANFPKVVFGNDGDARSLFKHDGTDRLRWLNENTEDVNVLLMDSDIATTSQKGIVNKVGASADAAAVAAGAAPTKTEFDALLTELRDLKTKMRTAGVLA